MLSILWVVVSLLVQSSYTCSTAYAHAHNDVREGQITISSWAGCSVIGTIDGSTVQLWADGSKCPLQAKVPGTFNVRWDNTCKQILDLSTGPLRPYCPPSPSPTPVPPSPTPSPIASPTPVNDTVPPVVSITNPSDGAIVSGTIGVAVMATDNVGIGELYLVVDGVVAAANGPATSVVFGLDTSKLTPGLHSLFVRAWDNSGNAGDSKVVGFTVGSAPPTPTPTPAPSPIIPTPTPSPSPTAITALNLSPNSATLRLGECRQFSVVDQLGRTVSPSAVNWVSNQSSRVSVIAGRACYFQGGTAKSTTIYAAAGSVQSDRGKITFR